MLLARIAGLAYILYVLTSPGPVFFRLVLAGAAIVVVLTVHCWRAFALFATPFLIQLLVYDRLRLLSPSATGARIDVTGPRDWELDWFGVRTAQGLITPSEWLQRHTTPVLDIVCGVTYLGFMAGFLVLAAWWRFAERRAEATAIMWALLALHLLGYAIHVLHPTAPPWYVAQYGTGQAIPDAPPDAAGGLRFDRLLGVSVFSSQYGGSSSVFGAFPSLHVGQTFLAALFAWNYRSLRIVATVFFGLVFLSSVYLDHHYIVDGIAGAALAALVFAGTALIQRRTTVSTVTEDGDRPGPPVRSQSV